MSVGANRTAKNCHKEIPCGLHGRHPPHLARQIAPGSFQPAVSSGQRCYPCRRYDTVSRSVISRTPSNCEHTVSPKLGGFDVVIVDAQQLLYHVI